MYFQTTSPNLNQIGRRLYEWLDDSAHRWFSKMGPATAGLSLHLQFQSDLKDLPWEQLSDHAAPLCGQANRSFALVRRVGDSSTQISIANRPLRVLFMASSPQNTVPVLAFEDEERIILAATGKQPLELVVEESGSLNGLRERLEWAGPGFFDVIHLTGHADLLDVGPRMLMEDDVGERKDASANDIANALKGYWPRLLFLSGCKTGMAGANQAFPSLADALVTAGAPAVLAWGQPVGDNAASLLAGHLYHRLAIGSPIDEAVALARFEVFHAKLSAWHQLRMYADATPVAPIVSVPSSPGRLPLRVRSATDEFLDAGAQTKICSRDQFVGRRRLIQRSLKTLRSLQGDVDYSEGLILHGMGGLGKSSTAGDVDEVTASMIEQMAVRAGLDIDQVLNEENVSVVERGPERWGWVQALARHLEAKYPWLARAVIGKVTSDVKSYIDFPHIQDAVHDIVAPALGDGPTVIVSHSLGTVVAYWSLVERVQNADVPLLLTAGSPLGLNTIKMRLPQPLRIPHGVQHWLNVTDREDVVALHARLDQTTFIPGIENVDDIENGDEPHAIERYLSDPRIARAIHAALG